MKKWLETFRGARWLEILLFMAIAAALMLVLAGNDELAGDTAANSDELRMQRILSQIEGVGNVSVMISGNDDGKEKPGGVVVVASGADDLHVNLKIQNAVQALTGLSPSQIQVYASSE